MTDILLSASQLRLQRSHKTVLDNISLTLTAGRIMTLIGPNGCGKSTLIRVLLGLEQADSGSIQRQRGLRVGYMPQKLSLDQRLPLTVDGFLRLARAPAGGGSISGSNDWLSNHCASNRCMVCLVVNGNGCYWRGRYYPNLSS